MLVIAPDFDNRIDLPGAGLCPRPVDIDQRVTGFSNLVSLRVYAFAEGLTIDGEAEDDELFIVLLLGQVDVDVNQGRAGSYALRTDAGPRAVYLPPHDNYRLRSGRASDVAYARARPPVGATLKAAGSFQPTHGALSVQSYAESMDLALDMLAVGEVFAPRGRSGSLPERLVHVRSLEHGWAEVGGQRVADWETLGLAPGESVGLDVKGGAIDALVITSTV